MTFSLANYNWPAYQNRKPFAHQKVTVVHMLENPRDFILNEMGTGKTLAALWAIEILLKYRKIDRVYITAPLSVLKSVWAKEIFYNMPHLRYAICHGSQARRTDVIRSGAQIIIINPDGVRSTHLELMRRSDKHLLLIDELTTYKTHDSDRTDSMIKLAHTFKAVWGMTGELTPNSPVEAWSQAQVVNPHNPLLPKYFGRFRDSTMYLKQPNPDIPRDPMKKDIPIWLPKTGAEKLVAAIAQPSIRFLLRECIDLPPTIFSDVVPEMSAEQEDAYDLMRRQLYLETENGEITAANAAVKLMKLLQIAAGAVKQDDGTVHFLNCKKQLDFIKDRWLQTYNKKILVVCAFKASFLMLQQYAEKNGIKCGSVYGDINMEDRFRNIQRFQEGDLNWLLLQPQAAAHGLTLTASSHTYWHTLTPSNELYGQTNARTVRPGQTQTTHVIRKVTSKAEQHIANILDVKGEMSSSVMQLFKTKQL